LSKLDTTKFEDSEKQMMKKLSLNTDDIRSLTRKCEPGLEKLEQTTKTLNDALMKLSHRLVRIFKGEKCGNYFIG